MGIFDGLLLVSDFDGTLSIEGGIVPPRNLEALGRFTRGGGLFTVATGRVHNTFAAHAASLPLNAPAILGNGSILYDFSTDTYLRRYLLAPTAPDDLAALAAVFPTVGMELYHGDDIYAFRPNDAVRSHTRLVHMTYTECTLDSAPLPWAKALLEDDREVLLRAAEWMKSHCGDRYEIVFSSGHLLEVIPKGCTKGSMTRTLAGLLSVAPENVYCIGDNQNDIPLLEVSAVPYAPSDCTDEVRAFGAKLLCPCREGAVADLIDLLARGRS